MYHGLRWLRFLLLLWFLLPPPVRAQQILYDPTTSTQVPGRLGSNLLRWTQEHAAALNLQGWRIAVVFDTLPPGTIARSQFNLVYRIAVIRYDLKQMANDNEPWRSTVHETLHLRLAELTAIVGYLSKGDSTEFRTGMNAIESVVVDLSMAAIWKKPQ